MNNRILIIGFGEIAKRHYKNFKSFLPNSNIAFLTRKKQKYKNLKFFDEIKLAIKFHPNITVICSPANSHIYYAKIFSKLNSHLFIEKPVATKTVDIIKFVKFIKKRKITVLAGYNLRFDESLIFFKNLIKKRVIGDILSVKSDVGQYLPSWRKKNYTKSVSAQQELGGGVINELSHDIDIMYLLFKKINFYSGMSYKISNLKINTEDTSHVVLKSKFLKKNFFIFVSMDFYRHDTTRNCIIIGTKATIVWDGIKKKVTILKKIQKKIKFINLVKIKIYHTFIR